MPELYKISQVGDKVYIKVLCLNLNRWIPWCYLYVKEAGPPTDVEKCATNFKTLELAQEWINTHIPK